MEAEGRQKSQKAWVKEGHDTKSHSEAHSFLLFEEGLSCLALPSFAYTSTAQSLLYYTAFDQYKMEKERSGLEK